MKKILRSSLSLFLSLILVLGLAVPVFAEPDGGSDLDDLLVSIDPANIGVTAGDTAPVSAVVSQGNDGTLSYAWESNSSCVSVQGSGSSVTLKGVSSGSGTVSLTVTRSSDGFSATANCAVTVNAATAPLSVSIDGSKNIDVEVSGTKSISAAVSGGSGSYSYEWDWDGSVYVNGRSDAPSATVSGTGSGTGTVTLTVFDSADNTSKSVSWNVTVTGSDPLDVELNRGTIELGAGGSATLLVAASGGSGNYTYNWDKVGLSHITLDVSGTSATVTAVSIGRDTVRVTVVDNADGKSTSAECVVIVSGGEVSYDASASATVGSGLSLESTARNIANEYKRQFNSELSLAASVRFDAPSGTAGKIIYQNGDAVRANASNSYATFEDMLFSPQKAGTFTTTYTVTEGANTITGKLTVSVAGGAAITNATLSSSSLTMATYSSRSLSVSVTPAGADYSVSWSSSNTNVAYIGGSGSSVTVYSQGRTGTAKITATVTGSGGGSFSRTCTVTVDSSSKYDPTLTVTLGSDYHGTTVSDSMAKQFRNVYGYSLNNSKATISFSSTGNTGYGVVYLSNGSKMKANKDYTFTEWINMYFEPLAAGTFRLPYTLSYNGDELYGTVEIYIQGSAVSASISQTSMTLATYSNSTLSVNVTPSNAYYTVSWRSSNTGIVTVSGSGDSVTVKSGGSTGTATVTATVTDRNGVETKKSCTVTVSNSASNYNPSIDVTLGVKYTGTGISDALAAQFKNVYSTTINSNNASIRFGSTGNNKLATIYLSGGTAVKANTDYTFKQFIAMYLQSTAAGTFSVPYELTYNSKTLAGNMIINIKEATANASITLKNLDPYSFSVSTASGSSGSTLISSAITNAIGSSWSYLRFGSSNSNIGTLYRNSSKYALGSNNISKSDLGSLYFVPARGGLYSIPYTVYNSAGSVVASGTLTISVTDPNAKNVSFKDVPDNYWAVNYIKQAYNEGAISGYSDGTFGPKDTLTFAQFSAILVRVYYADEYSNNQPLLKWSDNSYSIVSAHSLWNHSLNKTEFSKDIARYDMASLIANVMRQTTSVRPTSSQLSDAQAKIKDFSSIPADYRDDVLFAYSLGLLSGYSDGTFGGSKTMTRAEASAVYCRMRALN